nr:multiubiquitin domain-containing protein [uncultured Arsenicibacter sp.]
MHREQNPAIPEGIEPSYLEYIIEGQAFQTSKQYITGAELKHQRGIPPDTELYLSIARPWTDELIENHTRVDLARPGLEYFYVRKKLTFTVNGNPFTWYKQYITESEIKAIGKIDEDDELFLKIAHPFEDELITRDSRVDLARPGKEHFISRPKDTYVLIINAQPKHWKQKTISFEQVITLAFGSYSDDVNKAYTVTFANGPKQKPKGVMVKGDVVHVKNEMKFDATPTDRS